jgi:2-methylcitrate dehydratase PrpD
MQTPQESSSGSPTRQLAEFVANTPSAQVPESVLMAARDALIDTLGCGLAGLEDEPCRIVRELIAEQGGTPQAGVWGSALRTTAADAALANAIAAHALDFDDSSLNLRGHPSALMMSTALAVGECKHASGREVLIAYACGLEVGAKLAPALGPDHYFRGWHTTATAGIFAATAIAARLMKLSAAATCHAFGIAASQSAGLTRNFGSMTKSLHVGHAARCGITSAALAGKGFTANMAIFEGKTGFIEAYRGERHAELADTVTHLGAPWELDEPGLYRKRFPCCYAAHRPAAGLMELLAEHRIAAADIRSIRIGYLPGVQHPMIHHNPQTGLEAKFSTEYCMAAAAMDGTLTIESFEEESVARPAVRALMTKVTSYEIPDDKVYNGLTGYNDIEVETAAGRFSKHIERTPGSPDWPVSGAALEEKFLSCTRKALPGDAARKLLEAASQVAALDDISVLGTLLARP